MDVEGLAVGAVMGLPAVGSGVVELVGGVGAEFLVHPLQEDHIHFAVVHHLL